MSIEYAEHQKQAIAFQQQQPYSICAMATGVGKSVTTFGSELVNLHQGKLDKCIFVCTKASLGEVLNDYNKFYSFQPKQLNSANAVRDFFEGDSTVAVTRYEWLKHFDLMSQLMQQHRVGMWFDEAQKIKNANTVAHKNALELRQYCSAFHAVTATPVMSKLDDLWGIFDVVDNSVLGSYDKFVENYYVRALAPHPKMSRRRKTCKCCGARLVYNNGWDYCTNPYCKAIQTPTGFIPYRVKVRSVWDLVEYKNVEQLAKRISPHMFCFFPKQDINYVLHYFDMSSETFQRYKAIAKDIDNPKDPTPFATRLIELQYVLDRSYEKKLELWKLANKLKSKGFVLYLSLYDTEGFHDTTNTLEQVKEVLDKVEGLDYKTYTGGDCDEDRDSNKKWFQEDCKNKCLIISRAGGASLNLQCTNQFIFYSLPDGFGSISQALGRVVRLFSAFKTFDIHVIQANQSVDAYKYMVFQMYSEIMQKLFNNNLIGLKEPMKYNDAIKSMIRQEYCWLN